MRYKFNKLDFNQFFELLEAPDYSEIKLPRNNYAGYGYYFLNSYFKPVLSENELREIGVFVYRCVKANKKNKLHLKEALLKIRSEKRKSVTSLNLDERIEEIRSSIIAEVKDEKWVKGDSFEEISKEAQRWQSKIKLLGLKSFKTSWFDNVRGRSDIVFTDETEDQADIKYYFNKPIFLVPEIVMRQIKSNFHEFQPGVYEFIEYLMKKIEQKKRKKNSDYVINPSIFLITTAKNFEEIDPDNNLLAINTNGNDRPSFKGLPEFLTKYDMQKAKENLKNPPLPVQSENDPLAGGGPSGVDLAAGPV